MAVIDIETSGIDPLKHDILQICILPLGPDLKPDTEVGPFYMEMVPLKEREDVDPTAMRTNGLDWDKLRSSALDPYKVAELFDEWFQRLRLPPNKSIIPLAHNYPFEQKFLEAWLGPIAMSHYFFQYRDSMALAASINDMADMHSEQYPFPKLSLKYLCSELKVENQRAHDAMQDCIATAEVYRRLVTRYKVH